MGQRDQMDFGRWMAGQPFYTDDEWAHMVARHPEAFEP